MVQIKLKWNKQVFDVELDPAEGVSGLKAIAYSLTSVPIDRQKLMAKGCWVGILKDEADLASFKISAGQQVMLMGTAEIVAKPKETISFIEDMSDAEKAMKGATEPAGLVNLGNTCYMNSTIQCLRFIPELRTALSTSNNGLVRDLMRSYNELDRATNSMPPYSFVANLRSTFPQFAEVGQRGNFMQQDAEEFYSAIITLVKNELSSKPAGESFSSLLGVKLQEELMCQETNEEKVTVSVEMVNKLVCNIQGGSGAPSNIDHLHEGIKLGLEGSVEKYSEVLGRDALWLKKQRIASLPRYLCFQFMRFFWKPTPDSRDHTGLKCKILRGVSFPEASLQRFLP